MNEPIKVDSFLSTISHLELIARELYNSYYMNLLFAEKKIVFERFKKEREDSVHINDKWKELYNDK